MGAWSMVILFSLAALAALVTVRRTLGASLSPWALIRIGLAAGAVGCIALVWQPSSVLGCVASLAVVGFADLFLLILLRELGPEDYELVQKVIGRA